MDIDLRHNQMKAMAEYYSGKRILVSGSTGMIGSRVVNLLLEINDLYKSGINIVALYRDDNKKNTLYANYIDSEYLSFIRNDGLSDDVECGEFDYLIHCAGVSGGSKLHLKDPLKVFEINLDGTRAMLNLASKNNCTGFLYISTYEIYGDVSGDKLISETTECNLDTFTLRNTYAEIKRLCESLCCAYSKATGINVYAARLTSTFGIGVEKNDPRFFAEFGRCINESRDIVLQSSGGTIRSYLDADDAAMAFLYILSKGENCNAYNLTNMNNAVSIKQIASRMIELSGKPVSLKINVCEGYEKMGFRKEGCTLMDTAKLNNIGWYPVYSMDDTLLKLMKNFE